MEKAQTLAAEAGVIALFSFIFSTVDSFANKRSLCFIPIITAAFGFIYRPSSDGDNGVVRKAEFFFTVTKAYKSAIHKNLLYPSKETK